MQLYDISFSTGHAPSLDPGFMPFAVWAEAYLKEADLPVSIGLERENGNVFVFRTFLRRDGYKEAGLHYLEQTIKLLLWSAGGFRVFMCGCDEYIPELRNIYGKGGACFFTADFMEIIYGKPFEIVSCRAEEFPKEKEDTINMGGHLGGCRIGFDAGGSDRKVSAVIDGKAVYSEEVVWFPKLSEDISYQYSGIVESLMTAASKMPRVDAIGISSAGVCINNKVRFSSLFRKVPRSRSGEIESVYERAAAEIGDVPLAVANDGDVTALAGAMSLCTGRVLGIAIGTSEAAGYVDAEERILGRLGELSHAPVDLQEKAPQDDWSGDFGIGRSYFSQTAVIRLASHAGIYLPDTLSKAEKLKKVQKMAEEGHAGARDIFRTIGCYLAYTIPLYAKVYDIEIILVLGRVLSGAGGELLVGECRKVFEAEYPELAGKIKIMLPDEKTRRIGQSIAAASLPEV